MSESALTGVYVLSAVAALAIGLATARSGRTSWFGHGLLIYLAGTFLWSVLDLVRVLSPHVGLVTIDAWSLPIAATVIAGARITIRAASRHGWNPNRVEILSLIAHPLVALAVAIAGPVHHFVSVQPEGGALSRGPLFWLHVVVSYLLLALSATELIRSPQARRVLKRPSFPGVVIIWAVPLVGSVLTLMGRLPEGLDLVPPAFALTAVFLWRVVLPAEVAPAVPIARGQVFDEIADAVFVVHADGTLIDANRAALALVGAERELDYYKGMSLLSLWAPIAEASRRTGEYDLAMGGAERVVDVSVAPVADRRGARIATAVVMRDVTEAAKQRRELARLRAELADAAIRDAVTGLHNRRYAEQALPDAIARCKAKGTPMSVVVIDVDHFKNVNDTFGHSVGDRVLQVLSQVMLAEAPSSMVARIGGEEFLVMLPGLDIDQARRHAERIRTACEAASVPAREGLVSVTLSAGVATLTGGITGEQLIDAADEAMYRAKREGRNRTCVAVPA